MATTFTLESFKDYVKSERSKTKDDIDVKNGRMTIHKSNINKYLEKYMCKNENDLFDTLYNSFGIWMKIID